MEKIKLVSLGLLPEPMINQVDVGDTQIEVKFFLSYEDVLDMIGWTVNKAVDDRGYVSEAVRKIIKEIAIVKYYTNLDLDDIDLSNFTHAQLYEMYDLIAQHRIIEAITPYLDATQLAFYETTTDKTIDSLVAYRNSAAGVLEMINANGANTSDHFEDIMKTLGDEEQLSEVFKLLKLVDPNTPQEPRVENSNPSIPIGGTPVILK